MSTVHSAPGRGIEFVSTDVLFPQGVWDDNLMTWVAQTAASGVGSSVSVTNIPHVIVDTLPAVGLGLTNTELRLTPVPVSGTFYQGTQPVSLASAPSTPVTNSGTFAVQATGTVTANAGTNLNTSALALEAGHLATIDTSTARIPAQGQALAAASMPVVLTAAQVTTLTPPAAIAGFGLEATQLLQATAAKQDTGNASLATIAGAIKAEDTASADGDSGMVTLSVREDVPNTTTSDNGDRAFLKSDNKGRVWVASDVLGPQLERIGDLLAQLLIETNVSNELLLQGLNVKGELDGYRRDSYFVN